MKYPIIEVTMLISILGLILLTILRIGKYRRVNMMNATLTVEELELHAKRSALTHAVTVQKNIRSWPLNRINDNYAFIKALYKDLNDEIRQKRAVPPAAEWILDNYYIIEERTKSLRRDLTKKEYYRLPVLKKGPFKGYPRVLAIAMEFQSHSVLFDREIRIIPMMLQIALLENVRMICENIKETQEQWNLADAMIDKWWSDEVINEEKMIASFKNTLENTADADLSFMEHLFYRFRRSGKSYIHVLRDINEYLIQYSTTT